LQQLIEAKTKGLTIKPRAVSTPGVNAITGHRFDGRPETQPRAGTIRPGAKNGKRDANQASTHRRQLALLLPLTGDRQRNQRPSADRAVTRI
jgi:hypothetical protein